MQTTLIFLITDKIPNSIDEFYEILELEGIYDRCYFYPLVSELPMYRGLRSSNSENLANSSLAASQILCLPIFP